MKKLILLCCICLLMQFTVNASVVGPKPAKVFKAGAMLKLTKVPKNVDGPYARIEIQDVYEDWLGFKYANVYVRFYYDQECTNNYYLPNDLTINHIQTTFESMNPACGGYGPCGDWVDNTYYASASTHETFIGYLPINNEYGPYDFFLEDWSFSSYLPVNPNYYL